MFESPPTSWFSILFPSTMLIKSCGLTPEGKRIADQERRQAQTEADASERESLSPPGSSSGTIHQFRSFSSPVLLGGGSWTWSGCDGLAPWASTASQHTTTPNSLKETLFTVCFSHREARQRPTSSVFWCFICIYIWIWIYCANVCECCCFF